MASSVSSSTGKNNKRLTYTLHINNVVWIDDSQCRHIRYILEDLTGTNGLIFHFSSDWDVIDGTCRAGEA